MIGNVDDGKPRMLALPPSPDDLLEADRRRYAARWEEIEQRQAAERRATRPPPGWKPEPASPAAVSANGSAPGVVPPPAMPPRAGVQPAEAVLSLARCPHCGGHVGLVPVAPAGRA
jgi:hypothetical protein